MMMAAASYPDMVQAIGLPEGHSPYVAMMVGYQQYCYTRIPARKPAGSRHETKETRIPYTIEN